MTDYSSLAVTRSYYFSREIQTFIGTLPNFKYWRSLPAVRKKKKKYLLFKPPSLLTDNRHFFCSQLKMLGDQE